MKTAGRRQGDGGATVKRIALRDVQIAIDDVADAGSGDLDGAADERDVARPWCSTERKPH